VTHPARLAQVVRSGLVESVHRGSVAVTGEAGELIAWAGDPDVVAFARSSMKPLQAAVSLSLVDDDLSDAEIAVMCASHNGEDVHVEQAGRILERAGLGFDALRCPPSRPLDPEAAAAVAGPEPRYMNCSGKHAGMLLACVRQGWDLETYRAPDHPLQRRILDAVRLASDEEPRIGVDGCGIPVHAISLRAMALTFARLARPARLGSLEGPATRALAAMRAEPYLVAGRDRVCTDVMSEVPGVAVKIGAEGMICAAVADPGWGVAVKVDDGASRAAAPALIHTLFRMGVVDAAARERLAKWAEPPVLGGGRPVGSVAVGFDLERG
jgi:L-asparaginase II